MKKRFLNRSSKRILAFAMSALMVFSWVFDSRLGTIIADAEETEEIVVNEDLSEEVLNSGDSESTDRKLIKNVFYNSSKPVTFYDRFMPCDDVAAQVEYSRFSVEYEDGTIGSIDDYIGELEYWGLYNTNGEQVPDDIPVGEYECRYMISGSVTTTGEPIEFVAPFVMKSPIDFLNETNKESKKGTELLHADNKTYYWGMYEMGDGETYELTSAECDGLYVSLKVFDMSGTVACDYKPEDSRPNSIEFQVPYHGFYYVLLNNAGSGEHFIIDRAATNTDPDAIRSITYNKEIPVTIYQNVLLCSSDFVINYIPFGNFNVEYYNRTIDSVVKYYTDIKFLGLYNDNGIKMSSYELPVGEYECRYKLENHKNIHGEDVYFSNPFVIKSYEDFKVETPMTELGGEMIRSQTQTFYYGKFELVGGETYELTKGEGNGLYIFLTLFDESGKTVCELSPDRSYPDVVTFTVPESGTYYALLNNCAGGEHFIFNKHNDEEVDDGKSEAGLYVTNALYKDEGAEYYSVYDWDNFDSRDCFIEDSYTDLAFRYVDEDGNSYDVSAYDLYFVTNDGNGNSNYLPLSNSGISYSVEGYIQGNYSSIVYEFSFSGPGWYELAYCVNNQFYGITLFVQEPAVAFYKSDSSDLGSIYDDWKIYFISNSTTIYAMLADDTETDEYGFAEEPFDYITFNEDGLIQNDIDSLTCMSSEPIYKNGKLIGYALTFDTSKLLTNEYGELWLEVNGYRHYKNGEYDECYDNSRVIILKEAKPGMYVTQGMHYNINGSLVLDEYNNFDSNYCRVYDSRSILAFNYVTEDGSFINPAPSDLTIIGPNGEEINELWDYGIFSYFSGSIYWNDLYYSAYTYSFSIPGCYIVKYCNGNSEYEAYVDVAEPAVSLYFDKDKLNSGVNGTYYEISQVTDWYFYLGEDTEAYVYRFEENPFVIDASGEDGNQNLMNPDDVEAVEFTEIADSQGKVIGYKARVNPSLWSGVTNTVKIGVKAYLQEYDWETGELSEDKIGSYAYVNAVIQQKSYSEDCEYTLENGIVASYSKGVLRFSGEGAIRDYSDGGDAAEEAPWDKYKSEISSIVFEEGITEIGAYTFEKCYQLVDIFLPSTLKKIGIYAFGQATHLNYVYIPDGVVEIGDSAFNESGCVVINIPASVKSIGSGAFGESNSLESINVDVNNEYYKSIDGVLFELKDGVVYTLLVYPNGKACDVYEIPEGVKVISDTAFGACRLKKVVFPKSIETIGSWAFLFSSLEEVEFPETDHNIDIGQVSFEQCSKLNRVVISSSVKNVNYCSFDRCVALKSVILKDGVESISEKAFEKCYSLEYIVIPSSVKTISSTAFFEANPNMVIKGYTNSIAEEYAKNNNIQFESIGEVELEIAASGVCINDSKVTWTVYTNGLLEFEGEGAIPEYPYINSQPWRNYNITTVKINEGITSIGTFSFMNMKINKVELPDSLTYIGQYAFEGTDLSTITIPKNVKNIGMSAFSIWGDTLKSIYVDPENQYYWSDGLGLYDYNKTRLIRLVTKTNGWEVVRYEMPDSVEIIEPYAIYGNSVNIKLSQNLKTICSYAFYRGWADCMEIPASVENIPYNAFYSFTTTKFIVDPDNKKFATDENGVLYTKDYSELIKYPTAKMAVIYTVNDNTKKIDDGAFVDCYYLTSIIFPKGIESIPENSITTYNTHGGPNPPVFIYGYADSAAADYKAPSNGREIINDIIFLEIPDKEYKKLTIACPVDVYVYNSEGTLVAAVINEQVVAYDETIWAEDMEKTVYLPNSEEYTIEIKATGDGTVSYTMEEVTMGSGIEEVTNVVEFNDIPIAKGDVLSTGIEMMESDECNDYVISKNGSESITADTVIMDEKNNSGDALSKFKGMNLSLAEEISVNLYVELVDSVICNNDAYILVKIGKEQEKIYIKDGCNERGTVSIVKAEDISKNCYKISVRMAAADMSTDIVAQIYSDSEASNEYTFSVKKYLDMILDNESYKNAKDNSTDSEERTRAKTYKLVQAIATYGYYAQQYFERNLDALVIQESNCADIANASTGYAAGKYSNGWTNKENAVGVELAGSSLVLLSKPVVKVYFTVNSNVNSVKITDKDGKEYTVKHEGLLYWVEVPGNNICEAYKTTLLNIYVNGSSKCATLACSPFNYCDAAMKNGGNAKLVNLVKAYLMYAKEAYEYVN